MTRTPVDLALDAIADFTPTTPAQVHMLLDLWRGRWCLDDAHKAAVVARKVGWLSHTGAGER